MPAAAAAPTLPDLPAPVQLLLVAEYVWLLCSTITASIYSITLRKGFFEGTSSR